MESTDPRRIVLGAIPADAQVLPAEEHHGDLGALLDRLGSEGVLQLLVEGGAEVAGRFHREGLVKTRGVAYMAPALLGGDDGRNPRWPAAVWPPWLRRGVAGSSTFGVSDPTCASRWCPTPDPTPTRRWTSVGVQG
ncbi:MAG: hypothetical protein CM1200mP26_27870 [Acidimicrobiales bacterium]|nr:MAG: hypothetical protein CM1200mP26_27870 [Acidimicrobiales bacterium]